MEEVSKFLDGDEGGLTILAGMGRPHGQAHLTYKQDVSGGDATQQPQLPPPGAYVVPSREARDRGVD